MKRKALFLGAILVVAVLLGGCSGSGVKVARLTDTGVHALAADTLSAVQLFYGWLGVLYERIADAPAPDVFEVLPDGTIHIVGTFSDGGRYEYFIQPDALATTHGTIRWPDGTTFTTDSTTEWAADGLSATNHIVNSYPNGAAIDTVIVDDFHDPGGLYHGTWDGTARMPGGAAMHFMLDRRQGDRDELRLELPDGSVMTLHVPTRGDLPNRGDWPRFADGATGTFAAPGRGTSQIRIGAQAQPDGEGVWNRWQFTAADGTIGDFALETSSAGTGQLQQGGSPVGALRWTADALGTLDLLGAGVQEVTPSAAARDFRLDKWVRNTALLGPAPMY